MSESLPEVKKKESKDSALLLFTKSFLVVLGFLAVAAFISWAFGWVAFERHETPELHDQIVNGRTEVRRMAAAEWARQLSQNESNPRALTSLRPTDVQMVSLLAELRAQADKDPQLASGLVLILGFSPDNNAAREGLLQFMRAQLAAGQPSEAYAYALLSLARLGDPPHDVLYPAIINREPSIRKAAAFTLGFSREEEWARDELSKLLQDEILDVRWNAAFALARKKVGAARETLRELLSEVEELEAPTVERWPLYVNLFQAVVDLGDEELLVRLKKISMEHPNLKLRQAAKEKIKKD